jgi:peptidoglycan/LPS O-acetylase OafA/YrhL
VPSTRLQTAHALPPTAPNPASLLPSLTGLRWVTAVMIFGFHVITLRYFTDQAALAGMVVFIGGRSGVTMFFVLSGFVLAWGHDPRRSAGSFYVRRLARVYPLHLVGVVLALLVAAVIVPSIRTHGPAPLAANLLLVSSWNPDWWQAGNPVSWSLVCEAFFYLLFPVLFRLLSGRSGRTLALVVAACIAVALLAPGMAAAAPVPMDAESTPLLRLPEFAVGIVAAIALRQRRWTPPRLRVAVPLAAVGYVASVLALLPMSSGSPIQPGHAVELATYALLIASLAHVDARGGRTILAGPRWQVLGQVSFAFYLIHVLVLESVSSPWPGGHPFLPWHEATALMLCAFLLALALAWILHRYVEIPAQRLVMRLHRRVRVA